MDEQQDVFRIRRRSVLIALGGVALALLAIALAFLILVRVFSHSMH